MHRDKGPIGDDTSNADISIRISPSDQVFDCRGIEKLDIRKGEDLGQESRSKERLIVEI